MKTIKSIFYFIVRLMLYPIIYFILFTFWVAEKLGVEDRYNAWFVKKIKK